MKQPNCYGSRVRYDHRWVNLAPACLTWPVQTAAVCADCGAAVDSIAGQSSPTDDLIRLTLLRKAGVLA